MEGTPPSLSRAGSDSSFTEWNYPIAEEPDEPLSHAMSPTAVMGIVRELTTGPVLEPQRNPVAQVVRVLVINTGGTIGMVDTGSAGYDPVENALAGFLKGVGYFHDSSFYDPQIHGSGLITGVSKMGKRIYYEIEEHTPLVDSSDMMMTHWGKLARHIEQSYKDWDGFVVLHGTDTMAYTASALSFMLENLGKSVVITGSQVPIYEQRNDGQTNFQGALLVAGHFVVPEVTVFFNHKLFRGNRVSKVSSVDFGAFDSPNFPPLLQGKIDINIDWDLVLEPQDLSPFRVQDKMEENVAILRLFPGITAQTIKALCQPPIRGVVLCSFGVGNAPRRQSILDALTEACTKQDVIIVNITQCNAGTVVDTYAAGKALKKCGVIAGRDLTPEAALTKLSYVLAKDGLTKKEKVDWLKSSLRGELTLPVSKPSTALQDVKFIASLANALRMNTKKETEQLGMLLSPSIMLSSIATGNVGLVRALLQRGYSCNCRDHDLRTPLHIAARRGDVRIVKLLLQKGAKVHALDRRGFSPLHDAIAGRSVEIIFNLRAIGAHLHTTPLEASHVTSLLCAQGDINTLKLWICAGLDVNAANYDNQNLINIALHHHHLNIVWMLLNHANFDRASFVRRTAGLTLVSEFFREISCVGNDGLHDADLVHTDNVDNHSCWSILLIPIYAHAHCLFLSLSSTFPGVTIKHDRRPRFSMLPPD